MSVSINNSTLNSSVISQLVNANGADKAGAVGKAYGQLGLIEKIIDFFRGGVKRETIISLIDQIAKPSQDAHAMITPDATRLARFESLRNLAKYEHQDKFITKCSIDKESGTWGYELSIENTIIGTEKGLPIAGNTDFKAYLDSHYKNENKDEKTLARLDTFIEELHPGGKLDLSALRERFDKFNVEADPYTPVINQAKKFEMIAELLPKDILDLRCVLDLNKGEGYGSYSFKIGGYEFASANFTSIAPYPDPDEKAYVHLCAAKVKIGVENDFYDNRSLLSPEKMVDAVQDMADFSVEREAIKQVLHDSFYSSENFLRTEILPKPPGSDDDKMIAIFRDKDKHGLAGEQPDDKKLVLSNRVPSRGELRGEKLQSRLKDTAYENLYNLITAGYMTEEDSFFIMLVSPSLSNHFQMTVDNQKMKQKEINEIKQQLAPLKVGNTTLGKLFEHISILERTLEPEQSINDPLSVYDQRV